MTRPNLKNLLHAPPLTFLMEAHNGLSARIVSEQGFDGIWASGLSISAAHGVRDNNELSWTQVLDQVEFMVDASDVPILLDGDTGFGNFNNMRRLVQKLEQRGVAGVCIEDKEFPKTNSFIDSEKQPLADMDEFAGKIRAGKDAQTDPDFCIMARIEAFIAGWGLDEALKRANAYADAGADAILCHSKISTPDQVLTFMEQWDRDLPIVIVPTMYYSTPVEVFEEAGVSLIIWANHNLRSSITAMQKTTHQIYEEQSLVNVEDRIAPVKEIFRLQKAEELAEAEEQYLPGERDAYRAIILAATQGEALQELTEDRPKTMVKIGDRPLLHRLVEQLRNTGVKDIQVVRGYGKDAVDAPGAQFIDTDDYEDTGELVSLREARNQLDGPSLISYGDILFRQYILQDLFEHDGDIVITVDGALSKQDADRYVDYVTASEPHSLSYLQPDVTLETLDPELDPGNADGEWIGLIKATKDGSRAIRKVLEELEQQDEFRSFRFHHLFEALQNQGHEIHVQYVSGHWLDVDNLKDLAEAQSF